MTTPLFLSSYALIVMGPLVEIDITPFFICATRNGVEFVLDLPNRGPEGHDSLWEVL